MGRQNSDDVEYGLLENGLDFILSSTQYLMSGKAKSDIKYGLLHLSSGIELVFKYRLFIENWEYVFQNPKEVDHQKFVAGDFKSVDSKTCVERLKKHCNVKFDQEDDDVLKALRERRNKLEHFSIIDSMAALKAYLHQILSLVIDFIEKEIPIKNIAADDEELLDNIRANLGELQEFVTYRWIEIGTEIQRFAAFSTPVLCPSCFQKALVSDDGSKCLFCNYSAEADEMAQRYISGVLNINEYETVKDGGEYPQYDCPECGRYSFIRDHERDIWKCFKCGFEGDSDTMGYCETCGTPYQLDREEDIGMCDNCIDYRLGDDYE